MILAIFAQGVSAASSPCSMLNMTNEAQAIALPTVHESAPPCHQSTPVLDSQIATLADQPGTCCDEANCSMHSTVTGALFIAAELHQSLVAINQPRCFDQIQALSCSLDHLYRPPIATITL